MNVEVGKRLAVFPVLEQILGVYLFKQLGWLEDIESYESAEKVVSIGWNSKGVRIDQNQVSGYVRNIPFALDASKVIVPFESNQILIIDEVYIKQHAKEREMHDITYPLYELQFDHVDFDEYVQLLEVDLENFVKVAQLYIAAQLYGIAQECFDMTLAYVKERKQFGTEISKFQAVKHMLADMYLQCESTKVAIDYASWAIENNGEDCDIVGSIAKSYASDAAISVVQKSIQLHGAIGFTWEHDLHFYLKRVFRLTNMHVSTYKENENIFNYVMQTNSKIEKIPH